MTDGKNKVLENREVMRMKFRNAVMKQKDVKNEGSSGWSIENKGARKVLWMN